MGRPISKENQIEKIITSHPYRFHAKVIVLESMYKLEELTVNELIGDLHVFELHHLLRRQEQLGSKKRKKVVLKIVQESSPNNDISPL